MYILFCPVRLEMTRIAFCHVVEYYTWIYFAAKDSNGDTQDGAVAENGDGSAIEATKDDKDKDVDNCKLARSIL